MAETNDQHTGDGLYEDTPPATDTAVTQEAPDHTPEDAAQTERPIVVNQAGLGSMIAGGVIAAAIGAAGALTFLPEGWRRGPSVVLDERVSALEARPGGAGTSAIDEALAPLASRIAALEGQETAATLVDPLATRLSALETSAANADGVSTDAVQTALTAAIAPLSARLDALEGDLPTQTRAAVNEALAESRAEIDALAQSLMAREESVEEQQARIALRAAVTDLETAARTGLPAPEALTALGEHADVPADLGPFAEGIPTMAALQDSFPPAARAALAAAPAPENMSGVGDRVMNFLRNQTGARSLTPRDGADTDAVLSRAEASLRNGELGATLDALSQLPQGPAAAMAEWVETAQTRLSAMTALGRLSDQLNEREG